MDQSRLHQSPRGGEASNRKATTQGAPVIAVEAMAFSVTRALHWASPEAIDNCRNALETAIVAKDPNAKP